MIQIKIYTEKTYYLSKWGHKEYLDGSDSDNTLIEAAILTGKGLDREEQHVYSAYGKTEKEAEKALKNYLEANPNHPIISRKEIIN